MNTCKICGFQGNATEYEVYEMMYGTKERFVYFHCPECDCLQIKDIPDNLGQYYQSDYYSYHNNVHSSSNPEEHNNCRVLDVGCGAGDILCSLASSGYTNLTGCDPFIEKDLVYENGVRIFRRSIHEMNGEYDYILMHDSFEHMTDPHDVFDSLYRLLSPNGIAHIHIPVFPNIAFEMFGANWYQLDAPRHIFLHSTKSMHLLAQKHNLTITNESWDSSSWQFTKSFLYQKGIPYTEQTEDIVEQYFTPNMLSQIEQTVKSVNKNKYGDHAIFVLKKITNFDKDSVLG